jgi:hypothetical protein
LEPPSNVANWPIYIYIYIVGGPHVVRTDTRRPFSLDSQGRDQTPCARRTLTIFFMLRDVSAGKFPGSTTWSLPPRRVSRARRPRAPWKTKISSRQILDATELAPWILLSTLGYSHHVALVGYAAAWWINVGRSSVRRHSSSIRHQAANLVRVSLDARPLFLITPE